MPWPPKYQPIEGFTHFSLPPIPVREKADGQLRGKLNQTRV